MFERDIRRLFDGPSINDAEDFFARLRRPERRTDRASRRGTCGPASAPPLCSRSFPATPSSSRRSGWPTVSSPPMACFSWPRRAVSSFGMCGGWLPPFFPLVLQKTGFAVFQWHPPVLPSLRFVLTFRAPMRNVALGSVMCRCQQSETAPGPHGACDPRHMLRLAVGRTPGGSEPREEHDVSAGRAHRFVACRPWMCPRTNESFLSPACALCVSLNVQRFGWWTGL